MNIWLLEFSPSQSQFHISRNDTWKAASLHAGYHLIGLASTLEEIEDLQLQFAALNDIVWVEDKLKWIKKEHLRAKK